jgi:lysophospholipase L1-like esterase
LSPSEKVELEPHQDQAVTRPAHHARADWEDQFKEMAEREDDKLLDDDTFVETIWDDDKMKITIEPESKILFQGDSITDAERNREITQPNHSHALGFGYCNHIAAQMLRNRLADKLQFYNRGISGNRIVDLYARWKADAINLKPDIISILVGVNDTWHEFTERNGVEPERYEMVYRLLLDYTRQQLPSVQFVLCEPFVLKCGVVTGPWIDEIRQRQQIVKRLANEFKACFVPFQSALDGQYAPPEYWLADGVHPTIAGHRVLAECWCECVMGNRT